MRSKCKRSCDPGALLNALEQSTVKTPAETPEGVVDFGKLRPFMLPDRTKVRRMPYAASQGTDIATAVITRASHEAGGLYHFWYVHFRWKKACIIERDDVMGLFLHWRVIHYGLYTDNKSGYLLTGITVALVAYRSSIHRSS
jgi:hypothetical protein